MHRPRVSFVVLCYRTEPYVAECIDSILAQKGAHDFEIVALDDCSPDGTANVLRAYCHLPNFRLIEHEKNQGHIAGIQNLLAAARGEYIARIDSDDRYRPDFLNTVLPKFERYPDVGMVYADTAMINSRGEVENERQDTQHNGADYHGNELVALLAKNFICAPTIIARREAWLECLPVWPGLAFHDWFFTVLMAQRWNFYYCHQVLADYRVHPGNLHSSREYLLREEDSIFRVLHHVFSHPASQPEVEAAKLSSRGRILSGTYSVLADKYFGSGYYAAARRCYLRALLADPTTAGTSLGAWRRLAATLLGPRFYEAGKAGWRKAMGKGDAHRI